MAQPIWLRKLRAAMNLAGHLFYHEQDPPQRILMCTTYHPNEYLGKTIVLRPNFGPQVAISAGGMDPMILKNRRVTNESHQPK